jgi:hypothetical protein
MVRNELSPKSNCSNHCIFTKTRPEAGFSQCDLYSFSCQHGKGCLEIKSEISKFWSRKRAKKNQGKQRNQNFTKESEKIVIRKLGYRKDGDSKTGVQKR